MGGVADKKMSMSFHGKHTVRVWIFCGAVLLQPSWSFSADAAGTKPGESETAKQAAQQSDGNTSDVNKADQSEPEEGTLKQVNTAKLQKPDESVSSLPRVQSNLSIPHPEKFVFARVRELERKLDRQMAVSFYTAKRLHKLRNNVHAGFETDSKLVIYGQNTMGPRYALQRATYYLDDNPKPIAVMRTSSSKTKPRDETGRIIAGEKTPLFEGFVTPGCHTLRIHAVYRGGKKPFPYKTNVSVTLKGEQSFLAQEGRTIVLQAVSFEDKRIRVKGIAKPDLKFVMSAQSNRVKGYPLVDVTDVFNKAALTVTLDNRLMSKNGEKYTLVSRRVYVDGAPLSPLGAHSADNVVHNGPVAVGPHRLDAVLTFRGPGRSYDLLGQHEFSLKFRKDFRAEAQGETKVNLVAVLGEADSFQVERKPAIRIKVTQAPAAVGGIKLVNSCKSYEYWHAKKRQASKQQVRQQAQTVAERK